MKVDAFLSGGLGHEVPVATAARAAGYDGLWSAELDHDPFLPLARAADAAAPMELGTSIVVAFARSPMTVAGTAWDLQALSGGRFILGLGSQVRAHIERRFSMPWSQPAARMREFIQALHAIWASWQEGVTLDFQGDFYTHTLMTPNFDPGPLPAGRPQVYLAAVGTAMTRAAAEVADGLLAHGFTTQRYLAEVTLPTLQAGLDAAGRSRDDFVVKYSPFVVTGADEAQMARSAQDTRERIAFYASTPAYRPVLELHGWGELQTELNHLARKGQWKTMGGLISDEVLEAFALVAPPDQLPTALGSWLAGLADRTSFTAPEGTSAEGAAAMLDTLRASWAVATGRPSGAEATGRPSGAVATGRSAATVASRP
jgi:probable F420-dependent oxidoreductase